MPRSESVRYWRGRHATIPNDMISGRLLFEEDTGDVFVEYNDYETQTVVRRKLTDTDKFATAGGTFQGPIYLYRDPEEPMEAATKHYVDDLEQNFIEHRDDESIHINTTKIFAVGDRIYTGERAYWNQKENSIPGKGLSTNDFTDEYKAKLDSIAEDADDVSFSATQLQGVEIGKLTIGDVTYTLYAPEVINISGNANTANSLTATHYFEGMPFNGTQDISHFATCSTDGSDNTKVVQLTNYIQRSGSRILVDFINDDTSTQSTRYLKVNSYEPVKITYRRNDLSTGYLNSGVHEFIFGGNEYKLVDGVTQSYTDVSDSSSGLMTPELKQLVENMNKKLNTVEENANHYVLPIASDTLRGGVIIGDNISFDSTGKIYLEQSDIINALGYTPLNSGGIDSDELADIIGIMQGATDAEDGKSGLVPQPTAGDDSLFLKGDGTWDTLDIDVMTGATETEDGESGLVPAPMIHDITDDTGAVTGQESDYNKFLRGDGVWADVVATVPTVSDDDFKAFIGIN